MDDSIMRLVPENAYAADGPRENKPNQLLDPPMEDY
jgi:hypothetical protein